MKVLTAYLRRARRLGTDFALPAAAAPAAAAT
jgi:hypothetical protein